MSKLKIGNNEYTIKETSITDTNLGEDNRGRIWYEKLSIYLDKELPNSLKIQTAYHELAHAICEESSFNGMLMEKLGDNGYEIFINSLGSTIMNFVYDNNLEQFKKSLTKESK